MADNDTTDVKTRLTAALGGTGGTGQYEVIRTLGHGGMGTVFLARDLTLDREIAIKVISPELAASPELRQRFLQEARTVAKLRHPNIVAVYSAGEANGLLYFVMEFVPGESLRDLMTREQIMKPQTALPILRDLALALDYAHQAGVVHRDVKPENVLLDKESGRAMLTDFGVAVALAAVGDSRLTGAGLVLGSPRYMSPEQASGERSLDGRSDLYSLGLIGYEMFSGSPAIDAPTAASVLVKQLTEVPRPLALKATGTPAEVGAAIDRVLAKNPADRFSKGFAFAAALNGEEETAAPNGTSGRSRAALAAARTSRRKLWSVGAGIAAIAAVAIGWFMNRDTGNTRLYFVTPFEVQTGDRSLAWLHEGSVNMLSLALSQWTDLSVVDYERSLDLLREAHMGDNERIGLEEARNVARRAGAGTVIMGLVSSTADSIHVVARLYNVASGRKLDEKQRSAPVGDDPRGVFQAIASDLLDLSGGPKVTVELTKATTTSVDAYRSYVEGVRALNAWRLNDADSLLLRATQIDSTFALAHYKRAIALGWKSTVDRQPHVLASQKAVEYKDRLPKRLQEIVVANYDLARAFLTSGADARALFEAARTRLSALVKTDSLDAEAWYGLADADFHEASTGIMNIDSIITLLNQSQNGFRRAIALDSTNHLAYQHLVGIYQMASVANGIVLDGDTLRNASTPDAIRNLGGAPKVLSLRNAARTRGREAAQGWLAADPDAAQAYRSLSDSYAQSGNTDSAVAVLEQSMSRPATASVTTPYRIALLEQVADDPRAIVSLRNALNRFPADSLRARGEADRMTMLLSGLSVAGASGSVALLDTILRTAVKTDSLMVGSTIPTQYAAGIYVMAIRMGMGLVPTDAEKRALLRGISEMEPANSTKYADVRVQSVAVPYVAFLATKDRAFADAAKRWTNARGANATLSELDALDALAKGDTARASKLVREFPSVDSLSHSNIGMAGLRMYARAEAAAGVGDLKRAVGIYEAIDPKRFSSIGISEPGFATYQRSFLARGRLYEQLGEREKAMTAYESFINRWKNADAPLQPQVREAREALARLRDNSKPVPMGTKRG